MNNKFAGNAANLLKQNLAVQLIRKGDIISKWYNRNIVVQNVRGDYLIWSFLKNKPRK